jgi:transcriptional regulator with XRE-family HTH domain
MLTTVNNNFPVDRYLRAARRRADLSQRELAERAGVANHVVARAEAYAHLARVQHFAQLLESTGLHLIVVDDDGVEVSPEVATQGALKDRADRRFPAHLDVRPGKDGWWGSGWPMFEGKVPAYTFDRERGARERLRRRLREHDDRSSNDSHVETPDSG